VKQTEGAVDAGPSSSQIFSDIRRKSQTNGYGSVEEGAMKVKPQRVS